ncbi:MAG: thiamine-phosphate kinase [Moorellales bacterium]
MRFTVSQLGEVALLRRLLDRLPPTALPVGPGDDAAAFTVVPGHLVLATTDTLVEGVHFRREWAEPWQIGYKALAVNLSDIAAMGGRPTFALVALGLPGELSADWVDGFYEGLEQCARQWGAFIIGGDTVAAPVMTVTITLLGEVEPKKVLSRQSALPGDLLVVTGDLGASAAGLEELERPLAAGSAARASVRARHLLPRPRIREGRILAGCGGVGAVIDLSDGLARGAWEIASASKLGLEIYADHLPISRWTREVAERHGKDPVEWALYGGEDYELLFSVRPSEYPAVRQRILDACGSPVSKVGTVLSAEAGLTLVRGGTRETLRQGYEHFRS